MRYVGIDPSLSSTGLTIFDKDTNLFTCFFFPKRKKDLEYHKSIKNFEIIALEPMPDTKNVIERIYHVVENVAKEVNFHVDIEGIYIEGAAYSGGGRIFDLGQIAGALKYALYKSSHIINEVPIGTNKKYFTGKGNSNKFVMINYLKHHFGIDLFELFEIKKTSKSLNTIEDICDSISLACYGANVELKPKEHNIVNDIIELF
jgi:Holliday junction resolvasome RuvABC endonuclease subunit